MAYIGKADQFKNKNLGIKLHFNGFYYHKDKEYKEKTVYWECDKRKEEECTGRLTTITSENEFWVKKETEHNHPPQVVKKNKLEFLSNLKEKALSSRDIPSNIVRGEKRKLDDGTKKSIPKDETLSKKIKRIRYSHERANFKELEFTLPDSLAMLNREEFCIVDDYDPDKKTRMLVFTTNNLINFASQSEGFIVDGTFSIAPVNFSQVYTIHALVKINGKALNLFCVLTNYIFFLYFKMESDIFGSDLNSYIILE